MKLINRTRPSRRIIAGAGAAVLISGLSACGQSDSNESSAGCDESYTIGYSNPASEAAAVKTLIGNLKAEVKERGCLKLLVDNTQKGNLENQQATIESWVSQKLDAIVVTPVDATALKSLRAQAKEQDIKWVSYGVPEEGADGLAGFDNKQSGKIVGDAAAAWVASHHPDGDVTAAVTQFSPIVAASGRWEGPLAAMKAANVPVESTQDCADQVCGQEIAESLIQKDPKFRVFLGFNDDAALGAAKAFEDAGVDLDDVFIGGQDGSPVGLQAVKDGKLDVVAAVIQADLAKSVIDTAINAITGTGPTENEADFKTATLDDQAGLDTLLAQFSK